MRKGLYLILSLLVVFSLGAVFLHCGEDDKKCEEGQECCEAVPACPEGLECNTTAFTCVCEGELECCEAMLDCPGVLVCDTTTNTCKDPCIPDECCEGDPECPAGTRCDFSDGTCKDCCADAPAGELHITVSGIVMDMTTQQGIAAALTPISPMDALTNENPTHLDDQVSAATGLFLTNCFDVKMVALGCVMLSDDVGFDGIAGTYFPSGTGVKAWSKLSEKFCVEEAKVFAVPNTLVGALDLYTNVDSAGEGFVMGFVVDSTFSMVADAVIKKGDGTDLTEVIYPAADFSAFDGTATSASGIFVLPHTNFTTITELTAEKTGMTFGIEQAATKAGFCYFTFIQAE